MPTFNQFLESNAFRTAKWIGGGAALGGYTSLLTTDTDLNHYKKKNRKKQAQKIRNRVLGGMIRGGITGGILASVFNRPRYNPFEGRSYYSGSSTHANIHENIKTDIGKQFHSNLNSLKTKAEATRVFREAAMKHHPDKGGSVEAMKDINGIWNEFKKYKFNKLAYLQTIRCNAFNNEFEKIAGVKTPSSSSAGTTGFGLKNLIHGKSNVDRKPFSSLDKSQMGVIGGSVNSMVKHAFDKEKPEQLDPQLASAKREWVLMHPKPPRLVGKRYKSELRILKAKIVKERMKKYWTQGEKKVTKKLKKRFNQGNEKSNAMLEQIKQAAFIDEFQKIAGAV